MHSLDGWQYVTTELGDVDVLLDLLGDELAGSSRQRALSTLRRVCGWLVRRHRLPSNPCDAPELSVKRSSSGEVLSFRPDDLERLLAAAAVPPRPTFDRRGRPETSPRRDHGALRAACQRTDRPHRGGRRARPATGVAQGARRRERWQAAQRADPPAHTHCCRCVPRRSCPSVRRSRRQVSPVCAQRRHSPHRTAHRSNATTPRHQAGVTPPDGAMAHALRHAYGMDLAMRGVPLSVVQQLLGPTTHEQRRSTPPPTPKTCPPLSLTLGYFERRPLTASQGTCQYALCCISSKHTRAASRWSVGTVRTIGAIVVTNPRHEQHEQIERTPGRGSSPIPPCTHQRSTWGRRESWT